MAVICSFVFGVLWLCVLCFVFGGRVCCVWCSCYKYYGSSTPAVFEFGVGLLGVFRMFGSMFCSCGSLFLFGQSGCLCGVCWCVLVFDVLPRFGFVRWLLGLVLSVGFVRACSGFGACLPPWCMYESVVCSVCVDSFPVCAVCLMCSGIRVYLLSRCVHLRCMYVRACVLRVYPVFVPVGVRFICCHE